jgi:hypothetical protein
MRRPLLRRFRLSHGRHSEPCTPESWIAGVILVFLPATGQSVIPDLLGAANTVILAVALLLFYSLRGCATKSVNAFRNRALPPRTRASYWKA